ncbi:hypothetical protein MHY_21220 [Megamonas hypermegale ART12/1]|nr:hypothetical protein MHY_21220 [Megamonas hypermegale ART12/1]
MGMGWIVPSIIGLVIGVIISFIKKRLKKCGNTYLCYRFSYFLE